MFRCPRRWLSFVLLPATLWAVTGRADNEACDLADLEDRLERMLELIDENYLYPEQLDYKAMIVEGLAAADEGIPDLVVTHDPALGTVRVSTCEQGLDLALGTRPAKQDALRFLTRGLGFAVRTSCYRGRFAMSCADLRDRVLRGLSETLDPHTRYLGQDDLREFKIKTQGRFAGIGIVISLAGNRLTIKQVYPNTPAARAGLQAGMIILRIDDEPVTDLGIDQAARKLRGRPGTNLVLVVEEGNGTPLRSVTLVRAEIVLPPFEAELRGTTLRLVVSKFQRGLTRDLKAELNRLAGVSYIKGILLDLRDNPGGLLEEAISLADLFLLEGEIVATKTSGGKEQRRSTASHGKDDLLLPLVVLVNDQSASASEILAAALQRNDRALVLGQTSFGKGTIQRIFQLPQQTALKMTIGEFFGPGTMPIQTHGVQPDVLMLPITVNGKGINLSQSSHRRREATLAHVLATSQPFSPRGQTRLNYLITDAQPPRDALLELATQLVESPRDRRALLDDYYLGQLAAVERAMAEAGLDWRVDERAAPAPEVRLQLTSGSIVRQRRVTLEVLVHNHSSLPLSRYRLTCRSELPGIERELVLGRIGPAETRQAVLELDLPANLTSGVVDLTCRQADLHHDAAAVARLLLQVDIPTPTYRYTLLGQGERELHAVRWCLEGFGALPLEELRLQVRSLTPSAGKLSRDQFALGTDLDAKGCLGVEVLPGPYLWRDDLELEVLLTSASHGQLFKGRHRVSRVPHGASPLPGDRPTITVQRDASGGIPLGNPLVLRFEVEDADGIAHVVVWNGKRKIYYAGGNERTHLVKIPLSTGANYIRIRADDIRGTAHRHDLYLHHWE